MKNFMHTMFWVIILITFNFYMFIFNIVSFIFQLLIYIILSITIEIIFKVVNIYYCIKYLKYKRNLIYKKNILERVFIFLFIVLFIILIIAILFTAFLFAKDFSEIKIQDCTSVISTLGMISGAIWAYYQFSIQKRKSHQEKAALFLDDFSKEIEEKLDIILKVLADPLYKNELDKLKDNFDIPKYFDELEIKERFSYTNLQLDSYLKRIRNLLSSPQIEKKYKNVINTTYGKNNNKNFPKNFETFIEITLDRLEYECLFIVSSEDKYDFAYNSFHQKFLNAINFLQIYISDGNYNSYDRHYINIIEVFNFWTKKRWKTVIESAKINYQIESLYVLPKKNKLFRNLIKFYRKKLKRKQLNIKNRNTL